MLIPPKAFKGWKVWTVGDDIAWIRPGADGRLHAINPEAGFFGVAPGTGGEDQSQRHGHAGEEHDLHQRRPHARRRPVVGGHDGDAAGPGHRLAGAAMDAGLRPQGRASQRALHRARRGSARASIPTGKSPRGCRSAPSSSAAGAPTTIPLVFQAFNWSSGVYVGATMGSETTAAAAGAVGKVRRDPMAMLPFCGYHMGDYFRHWIMMQRQLTETPRIFHVNWFRKDRDGRFLWPGFGENMRILKWIVDRARGRALGKETPIGWVPRYEDIEWAGLDFPRGRWDEIMAVDRAAWRREVIEHEELFLDPARPPPEGDGLRARAADLPAVTGRGAPPTETISRPALGGNHRGPGISHPPCAGGFWLSRCSPSPARQGRRCPRCCGTRCRSCARRPVAGPAPRPPCPGTTGAGSAKQTVVRHDPSRPYPEQSQLLKINGREPTPREAEKHREAAEKHRNTKRVTLDDLVDLDHVTIVDETPASVTYDIPLLKPEHAHFPASMVDRFRMTVRVNKERRVFEHVSVQLREPLWVGPVKLSAFAMDLTFATVDPKYGPILVSGRGTGTGSLLFIKAKVSNERTSTDFKRVTPYDERFGVKIGPIEGARLLSAAAGRSSVFFRRRKSSSQACSRRSPAGTRPSAPRP